MSSLPMLDSTQGTATSKPADPELAHWQRRLLPFMTRSIVAMAVAFFLFSGLHLYHVTRFIDAAQGPNIREQIAAEIGKTTSDRLTDAQVMQHALLLLEADALNKRYHQASALLISRIWSRQMAFITGMVMAFLGAVFILGKMSDATPTQVDGAVANWKVALSSASPGIVLSFFGTALLITSLLVRTSLDVADGPAYLGSVRLSPAASSAASGDAPLSLDALTQLDQSRPGK